MMPNLSLTNKLIQRAKIGSNLSKMHIVGPNLGSIRLHHNCLNESCGNPLHNHKRQPNTDSSRKFTTVASPDVELTTLLNNNKKWVDDMLKVDPTYFDKVGGPQHPKYLYFGCADSRVPANEILGLGYLFTILNI